MLRIALLFIPFYAARRSLRRFADGLRAVDFFKAVAVIFGVGLLSAAWAESPDIAGRVQFVVGEVSAADRDGAARALGKRDAIFEGDTVTTGPSASAQIMMIDGARIAVRPNSAFMVNEYRAPSADDIGASILTLLKGGFRTLSGLIGEESAQYRIDTPCCAIGLRGTDHAVFHIPAGEEDTYGGGEAGTYNRVYKGATFLESAGVTLDITPQTDAGFAARGQPPVFVPDIPETAEGAVVLAPSENEDEESDESEAAENESKESESEDASESETETADADDSNSESDDAVLAESPADESSSTLETAETVEIASESAAPPVADLQNPVDIADALQRENTMPEPEPPLPVISLTSDLTMLQEGRQVILRVSSDIDAPSGGLMVTINIGNAMAGEFNFAGGVCTALECVVTIPENSRTAELILTPISDSVNEDLENWTATLVDGGLNYNIDDTMMAVGFDISDQPVIGIATADMAMVREGGEIRLTVSSDIAAPSGGLLVTINIGTAMAGEFGISGGDCSALECVVTIPAGMTEAELILTPISDTAMESAERWTATLVDGGLNYNIDDTMMAVGFDISDQPVIGIATADMAMVREGGEIRLTVSSDIAAPSGGLMVTINIGTAMAGEFGISGGVCSALECVVTIPAGMTEAELILTPISDTAMESAERWTATLVDGGLNYNIDDTMMAVGFDISDQPVIGIATADMAMVREGSEIRLTVSSDIAAPSGGLLVTINIGTAMAGEFGISGGVCSALECVVTIPAGMTEAELILTPISDTAMESAERWTATLVDGGLNYNIDDTMMAVGFDISDQPVIGIATADMAMVREGGEIRLTVSSDIAAPSGGLMVTINIGTAMAGEFGISGGDCSALECVVTIPAGMLAATLTITPISDSINEDLENWMATLVDGGLNYNIDNTRMNVGFDISDPHLNLQQDIGTAVGEHDIALQWEAHPDATGYRVYRRGTEIGDVTGTSFTHSLQVDGDSGDHHYRVVPYGSDGDPITDFGVDILAARPDDFAALGYEWDPLADESVIYEFTTTSVAICCIAATSLGTISFGTMESPRTDIRRNEIGEILAYSVSPEGERTLLGSVNSADITDTAHGIEWNPVMDNGGDPADLYEIVFPVGDHTNANTPTSVATVGRDVSSASVFDFGFRAKGFGGRRSGGRYRVFPRDSSGTDINSRETGDITRHLPANLPGAELLDPAELVGANIETIPDFPIGLEFEESPFEADTIDRIIYTRGQMLGEQQRSASVGGDQYALVSNLPRFTQSIQLPFIGNAFRLDEDSIWLGGILGGGGSTTLQGRLALVLDGPAFSGSGFLSGRSGAIEQAGSEVVDPRLFYRLEVGDRVMLKNYHLSLQVDDFFMGVTNVEDVALTGPETFFRVVGGEDCRLSAGVRCSKQSGPLGVEGLASFGLPEARRFNGISRAFTRFDLQRNDGSRISGRYVPSRVDINSFAARPLSTGPDNFTGSVDLLGGVILSWDNMEFRADYYAIFRDGVEIGVVESRGRFECIGDSLSTGGSGGCVDSGATPGATHEYTISGVDQFGRESPTSGPLEFTIPAAADLPPPFDSLAEPSDWIIGGATGIMAMRPNSDVLAAGEQFSAFAPADGSYVGFRIGDATANSRVVVFRTDLDGTGGFSAAGAQINDFDFRYAIETGAVNVLTDYNVRINLDQGGGNEIWNFGLRSNRRVNLNQAETGFRVSGTAAIGSSTNSASGAASFGTDNANVYSRFDVEDRSDARLLGRFSVPALPTP